MKYIYLIVLVVCFKSDSFIEQNQLVIELINKEIYFIELDPEIEQYRNEKERGLSYNLIKIRLKNVSGKKMLLFINPDELIFSSIGYYPDNIKYLDHGYLIESEGKIKHVINVLSNFSDYPIGLNYKENNKYNLRQIKYNNIGIAESEETAYNLYEQHSFILGANETKTLYFSLNLPIVTETNLKVLQNPIRYDKLEEGWDFKIAYQVFADNIYKDLPDFIKEELKENNIEIFNGVIYSNSVKLKKR